MKRRYDHYAYRVTAARGYVDTPCFCAASHNHPVGGELRDVESEDRVGATDEGASDD